LRVGLDGAVPAGRSPCLVVVVVVAIVAVSGVEVEVEMEIEIDVGARGAADTGGLVTGAGLTAAAFFFLAACCLRSHDFLKRGNSIRTDGEEGTLESLMGVLVLVVVIAGDLMAGGTMSMEASVGGARASGGLIGRNLGNFFSAGFTAGIASVASEETEETIGGGLDLGGATTTGTSSTWSDSSQRASELSMGELLP